MVLHSILSDLRKSYGALDRVHYLDIMAGYGVGHRNIRILQTYWARIQMAEKVGVHYGTDFHNHRRITQGDPLSPTMFNVVVDAVT